MGYSLQFKRIGDGFERVHMAPAESFYALANRHPADFGQLAWPVPTAQPKSAAVAAHRQAEGS
jgi:hypothetical protein